MEELKLKLKELEQEMRELQDAWATEIKIMSSKKNFDVYSDKTDREMDEIAKKYAEKMNDNLYAQHEIKQKIDEIKEEERKKQYKD